MIYIAELIGHKDKHCDIKLTDMSISREDYDAFMKNFHIFGQYQQLKELHDICLDENIELNNFLSKKNLNNLLRCNDVEPLKVLETGNKLLLNYCTAIRILVNKIEVYLRREHKDKYEDFRKYCSNFYDSTFSYRFFYRLRNYILHNKMPFTIIEGSIDQDCNIYFSRDELITWDKWSVVKNDLKKLDDNRIDIQPLLLDIGSTIYAIYMTGLYYMLPEILLSCDNIKEFRNKYGVKYFNFIEYESVEKLKKESFKIYELPWSQISQCIDELNKHPNVDIKKTEE